MEIWKKIIGFEDYKISTLGRVKSFKYGKEKILKLSILTSGYKAVHLSKKNVKNTKKIHQLVAIAFLNHNPCGMKLVVNHKDFNKLNNNVENLEIVTQRENANKKHIKSTSKYVGVFWEKNANKWRSRICLKTGRKDLGLFKNEYDAHLAYQKELNGKD